MNTLPDRRLVAFRFKLSGFFACASWTNRAVALAKAVALRFQFFLSAV
jgi:hypothetical protein